MNHHRLEPEITRYYDRGGEQTRLTQGAQGRLEFLRTQDILRRVLADRGTALSILDVGGATGVHAEWLAADGHRVHLIDPVASQVEVAARLPGVTAQVGDARALPVDDHAWDVVLMLGPLYHLTGRDDRLNALRDARRAVRGGGLVAAATISRFASFYDVVARDMLTAADWIGDTLRRTLSTGQQRAFDRGLFTTAYFHRPEEIAAEFCAAGLAEPDQFAIEGAAWLIAGLGDELDDDDTRVALLAGLRAIEREPSLLGISSHLLTVATAR